MEIRQDITLSVDGGPTQSYYAKQNDNNTRVLVITLTKNGQPLSIPASEKATVRYRREDGKGDTDNAVIENNKVIVKLTDEMLAIEGITYLDVVLNNDTDILSSSAISIITGGNPIAAEKITSTSDFLVLIKALERVDKNIEDVESLLPKAAQAIKGAKEAKTSAETATIAANNAAKRAEDAATGIIPAATAMKLGGIKAKPATDEATQEIYINEEGFALTKPSSSSSSFDIRASQIKDSKDLIWLDSRFKKSGYVESDGTIIKKKGSYYFSINVTSGQPLVLYSDIKLNVPFLRATKADGSFATINLNNIIPWLNNLKVMTVPQDVVSVEFNTDESNSIYYTDSFVNAVDYIYNGYSVFTKEKNKAYITECDNLYSGLIIENYLVEAYGRLSNAIGWGCTLLICQANKTYYVGYPYVDDFYKGVFLTIDEFGKKEVINQTTDLKKGFSTIYKEKKIKTVEYTPVKDCILIFNVHSKNEDWHNSVVVSTIVDGEDYCITDSISKINGKCILPLKYNIDSKKSYEAFDILPYQIKDSKSLIMLDKRFEFKGRINNNGEIVKSELESYFSINTYEGQKKIVLYSNMDIYAGINNIRVTKKDGTFINLVPGESNKVIPWLNLINIPIDNDVKSIEFNTKSMNFDLSNRKIGFSDKLLLLLKMMYKGYSVFNKEEGKAVITEEDNIYSPRNIVKHYYVDTQGNIKFSSHNDPSISVLLCEANTTYYIGYPKIDNSSIPWKKLTEDGSLVSVNQVSQLENGFTVIYDGENIPTKKFVPSEDCALIFTTGLVNSVWENRTVVTTIADKEKFVIENVITKINGKKLKDITKANKPNIKNELFGRKITVIGDSITEKNFQAKINWAKWIETWTGASIQNLGQSGTGFAKANPYINRIASIDKDVDLICVALSWNDLQAQKPVGTIEDNGTETLAGYANDFFTELLHKFPSTPILCFCQGPWSIWYSGIELSDSWLNVLSEICKKKHIPFYGDLYEKGCALRPWIEENKELLFKSDEDSLNGTIDGVHPNSEGHKIIAKYILPKIMQNIIPEYADYTLMIEKYKPKNK